MRVSWRTSLRLVIAAVLVAAAQFAPTTLVPNVAADCPGGSGNWYAGGWRNLTVQANGIAADIAWTQATQAALCGSGVSHSVTVCQTDTCTKWVQVGWRFYDGWADPKMYCEFTNVKIDVTPLSHVTHRYKMSYDTSDGFWDCQLDGVTKYSSSNAGFSSGNYIVAQGEAHTPHAQIGKKAPGSLLFSDMQYRRASNNTWPAFDIATLYSDYPYGKAEPAFGQLQVWTNAH